MLVIPFAKMIPLSPNTLTLIGLLVSIAAAVMFARGDIFIGGLLILLSGIFDILDGAVARASNCMTPFGGVLDSICDRYADAVVFVGIISGVLAGNISQNPLMGIPLWFWCLLGLIGSYLVSYTRARAEGAGAKSVDVGIAERPERMLILVAGSLTGFITLAIAAIVILTHITIVQRVMYAKKSLS